MKKIIYSLLAIFLGVMLVVILWKNIHFDNPLKNDNKIERIEIIKSSRTLITYQKGPFGWKIIKEYKVSLGPHPKGHKEREGDGKTPEGKYFISRKKPNSNFHLSLEISYPNQHDKQQAKKKSLSPGGKIMIHGLMNGSGWIGKAHLLKNWTKGCIALTNPEIEEIYHHTEIGTPIIIKP